MIANQERAGTTIPRTLQTNAGEVAPTSSSIHDGSEQFNQGQSDQEQLNEETWLELLVLGDLMPAPEEEAQAALTEMQRDRMMHLISPLLHLLVKSKSLEDLQAVAPILLPHLSRCDWCRSSLRKVLELTEVSEDHPAYAVLEDAEYGALWDAAGRNAAESAYTMLQSRGIGHVYGRDGAVYRRHPDGREERLHMENDQRTNEQIAK